MQPSFPSDSESLPPQLHLHDPPNIANALHNDTLRIPVSCAERDLRNLKKPMLFQCSQCKLILANSTMLKEWKRLKDNSFLLFYELDGQSYRLSPTISTEDKGSFIYCSYKSIICATCNSKIGMQFVSTTSNNESFLDVFTLIEQSVIRYDLGDTIQIDAQPGQNAQHEDEDKENMHLENMKSVPDNWTSGSSVKFRDTRKETESSRKMGMFEQKLGVESDADQYFK